MTVISFKFTKICAERKEGAKGNINIANNISVKDVKGIDLKLGSKSERALKFGFEFEAKYEPEIGNIKLNGDVVWLGKTDKVKEIEKEWAKNKKIAKEVMEDIMGSILNKCNIEALIMSREMNLPPPVPLPKVKKD